MDLAVLAVDDRMPPGDVHIGTAFLDGCHDDLAELIHPFFPPGSIWSQRCGIRLKVHIWKKDQQRMVPADVYLARNMPQEPKGIKI